MMLALAAAVLVGGAQAATCNNQGTGTDCSNDKRGPDCCQMREDIWVCMNKTAGDVCCPQSFSHGYGAVCGGRAQTQCCWGFSELSCYDNTTQICCPGTQSTACPNTDKCGGSTQWPKCVPKKTDDSEADGTAAEAAFMEDFYRRRGEVSCVDSVPPAAGAAADSAIDWVEKGAVMAATSQGRCATCQDFSAIADVESAWHLSGGHPLTMLSELELIDCGGGNQYGMKWIQTTGGVANIEHAPLANHSDPNLTGCRGVTNCSVAETHHDAYINGSTCLTNHVEANILCGRRG